MDYREAIFAIVVCLVVFIIPVIGILIYALIQLRKQQSEQKALYFKTQVLIDSLIEIFESKYKLYDEDDKGGIGPGA